MVLLTWSYKSARGLCGDHDTRGDACMQASGKQIVITGLLLLVINKDLKQSSLWAFVVKLEPKYLDGQLLEE